MYISRLSFLSNTYAYSTHVLMIWIKYAFIPTVKEVSCLYQHISGANMSFINRFPNGGSSLKVLNETLSLEISLVTWSMKNSVHKRILRGLFYNVGSWHYIWKPWENNSSDCLKSIDFRSVCLWERHGMSLMRWHKWLFYHCHCSDVFGWF